MNFAAVSPLLVPTKFEMPAHLNAVRQDRLRSVMRRQNIPVLLTADPINIFYGCGVRNMTVFGMMGPSRFLLLFAEGPSILYEFAGCEHLAAGVSTVDEVRVASGITPNSGRGYAEAANTFATKISQECIERLGVGASIGVERVDYSLTDPLRSAGLQLRDASVVFLHARLLKQPEELSVMREAVRLVELNLGALETSIEPGKSEVEIWAEFHRALIASEGEYVSTRLAQGGPNTFPYFQEAGSRRLENGDLFCIDTDAIGFGGYAVDLSRTFLCGDGEASDAQRSLYSRAYDQLQHNSSLLMPGRSFEDFARNAWTVPEQHKSHGYYCIVHGLGLCGEYPYVPHFVEGEIYDFPGEFEANMVVCCESYIGDPESGQGVKLEDQFLITETGVERLTNYPFDTSLSFER